MAFAPERVIFVMGEDCDQPRPKSPSKARGSYTENPLKSTRQTGRISGRLAHIFVHTENT